MEIHQKVLAHRQQDWDDFAPDDVIGDCQQIGVRHEYLTRRHRYQTFYAVQ